MFFQSVHLYLDPYKKKYWHRIFIFTIFFLPGTVAINRYMSPDFFKVYFAILVILCSLFHIDSIINLKKSDKIIYSTFLLSGIAYFLIHNKLNIFFFYMPFMLLMCEIISCKASTWLTDRFIKAFLLVAGLSMFIFRSGNTPNLFSGAANVNFNAAVLGFMVVTCFEKKKYLWGVAFIFLCYMLGCRSVIGGVFLYTLIKFLFLSCCFKNLITRYAFLYSYFSLCFCSVIVVLLLVKVSPKNIDQRFIEHEKSRVYEKKKSRNEKINFDNGIFRFDTPYFLLNKKQNDRTKDDTYKEFDEFLYDKSSMVRVYMYNMTFTLSFIKEVLFCPDQEYFSKEIGWYPHNSFLWMLATFGLLPCLMAVWKLNSIWCTLHLETRIKTFAIIIIGVSFGILGNFTFLYLPILFFFMNEVDNIHMEQAQNMVLD